MLLIGVKDVGANVVSGVKDVGASVKNIFTNEQPQQPQQVYQQQQQLQLSDVMSFSRPSIPSRQDWVQQQTYGDSVSVYREEPKKSMIVAVEHDGTARFRAAWGFAPTTHTAMHL